MRLFLTGASGYLGREIVRQAGIPAPARVEVLDADAVHAAAAGCDAVIHTAYRQDDARVNVEGSRNVALAAAAHGARLVHVSSDMVYTGDAGRPLREDDPLEPTTDYGRSKAQAEREVAAACPGAVLVRTSLIYGGPEPSRYELWARDPGELVFYEDELRCPVQVGDLASALLELAGRDEVSGPLNVAGPDAVSRLKFACLIAGRDDLPAGRRAAGRPGDLRLDCSRARALLATRVRGVREVLSPRAG